MTGPFPVRRRPPAAEGTRALVVGVVRATGEAAVERARLRPAPEFPRWSPYRLPGAVTRRLVGRVDRLLVERAGRLRAAIAPGSVRR